MPEKNLFGLSLDLSETSCYNQFVLKIEYLFRDIELQPKADQPPADNGRAVSAKGGPAYGWDCFNTKYMFFVYILRSLKNKKRYVGQTSKDVFKRLSEHNRNCNKWTKENGPFKLIHHEKLDSRNEAIKRELFLKSGQGRKWLDENIKE